MGVEGRKVAGAAMRLAGYCASGSRWPARYNNPRCVAQSLTPSPSHSAPTLDPYAVLGLPADASGEAVRQRYRELALRSTPDRFREPTCEERWRYYSVLRSYE